MALIIIACINYGCSGLLKEDTKAEPLRVTSPAMRHDVVLQLWRT
jgi:hypothetical protein